MKFKLFLLFSFACQFSFAQLSPKTILLKADRVFDGVEMHQNWFVVVKDTRIFMVGDQKDLLQIKFKIDTTINLPGQTLLPGLIEGHSHLFLHPYNETEWNDQVLKESRAERLVRAVNHAKTTLMAGFTTVRDLGTEGAGFDDVGLRESINSGLTIGPRMMVAGRAIVATGSYGPKTDVTELDLPKGAEESDGEHLISTVRNQIGHGIDVVKIYADYRWGLNKTSMPTFSVAEIKSVVETAKSTGRPVAAHAGTKEGMRRAIEGGVETIEHGDNGDAEVFNLMKEKGIALCPTIAAGDAISQYDGWKRGTLPEPARITQKHKSFSAALAAGVTICFGGDVGVFPHGDNAREMEMMVEYGMKPLAVLQSATSINAKVFHQNEIGQLKAGLKADIIAVSGNPLDNISTIRKVNLVMKDGVI
ncbi:MAG: amidohydrolase family protein, partial [Bacteroidetes bacterium]|nr:amidohydrolase family protein [Bacteroidota bacterium]MBU1762083.1 amidohydrolase family protein [Bacteroidota bacterium]